jgi:hypothetical protein
MLYVYLNRFFKKIFKLFAKLVLKTIFVQSITLKFISALIFEIYQHK